MDKNTAVKYLAKNFLGTEERAFTDKLNGLSKFLTLEPREILFTEGSTAENMYYVASGGIKLSRASSDGRETVIRFVTPGETFAEAMLANMDKYPVNASALEKSELLALNIEKIREFSAANPDFMMRMFGMMASRLRYLVDMINGLTADDAMGRLVKYLKSLSEKTGESSFALPVAKGELALLLGTTPETVSRLFARLKNDGIIKETGKRITLI